MSAPGAPEVAASIAGMPPGLFDDELKLTVAGCGPTLPDGRRIVTSLSDGAGRLSGLPAAITTAGGGILLHSFYVDDRGTLSAALCLAENGGQSWTAAIDAKTAFANIKHAGSGDSFILDKTPERQRLITLRATTHTLAPGGAKHLASTVIKHTLARLAMAKGGQE